MPLLLNPIILKTQGVPTSNPLCQRVMQLFTYLYMNLKLNANLKIGKVNVNSSARFHSQHYGFSAPSTLAKSICNDDEFCQMGINQENVKEWMLNHLHRVNILIRADQGKAATELVEAMLHYRFRPRYEGNI